MFTQSVASLRHVSLGPVTVWLLCLNQCALAFCCMPVFPGVAALLWDLDLLLFISFCDFLTYLETFNSVVCFCS